MPDVGKRRIVVSSRALGPRLKVTVHVYDTLTEMRTAATAWNGQGHHDTIGLCQATTGVNTGKCGSVLIRLACGHLGTQIVTHEMHHAATALYGAHVGDRITTRAHLNHYNEPFAHLYSDLAYRLVDRLHALGYYSEAAA